jgi:hypothetical protein
VCAPHLRTVLRITHLLGVPADSFGDERYNTGGPALGPLGGTL